MAEKYSLFNDLKIDIGQEPDNKDRFAFGQGVLTNPRAKYWDWELFKAWLDARIGESVGGGGELTEDITTTISAGGGIGSGVLLPEGMTFTDYVKAEHAPYRPPSFTSFQVNSNLTGTLEVGQTITITNAMFGMANDSEGNPPSNKHIIGAGFEADTLVLTSPHNADAVVKTVVRGTVGSEAWTIQGTDKNNVQVSVTTTRPWYFRLKFGASAIAITDNASAQTVYNALQQSWLQVGKTKTVTCTLDNKDVANKTIIMYHESYGSLIAVNQGSLPVLGAFQDLGTFVVNNGYQNITLRAYATNATGAFASGTILSIS